MRADVICRVCVCVWAVGASFVERGVPQDGRGRVFFGWSWWGVCGLVKVCGAGVARWAGAQAWESPAGWAWELAMR
jgi:hypothetical protein